MIKSVVSAVLAASVALLAPMQPVPPLSPLANTNPCECTVVNAASSTKLDDVCKCAVPGAAPGPSISASVAVYPQGVPANGECRAGTCVGPNRCTYADMTVNVTISACARDCTEHDPSDTGVDWKRPAFPAGNAVGSSGTAPFGVATTFTSAKPTALAAAECGTAPMTDSITFYKANGNEAFKLEFQFACGSCAAKRQAGR